MDMACSCCNQKVVTFTSSSIFLLSCKIQIEAPSSSKLLKSSSNCLIFMMASKTTLACCPVNRVVCWTRSIIVNSRQDNFVFCVGNFLQQSHKIPSCKIVTVLHACRNNFLIDYCCCCCRCSLLRSQNATRTLVKLIASLICWICLFLGKSW